LKTFSQALDIHDFAISAELPLTPDSTRASILEQARSLQHLVDAIHVPDNRFGRVHIAPLAVAAILLESGIDPVMEMGCRNRNRIALISDLLGARALGVTSLLLNRGKKAPAEFMPQTTYLVDTNVKDLIGIARNVYQDEELKGNINYLLGTVATVHDRLEDWSPERLNAKIESGANFVQTHFCLDIDVLQRYIKHLISQKITRRVSVVVGTGPLVSYESAIGMRDDQTHLLIPKATLNRLRQASDQRQEGIEICAEFLVQARKIPGLSGAHLSCADDFSAISATLEASAPGNGMQ
jgi:5,10-methylenetetrahydrofolate reductase